MATKYKIDQLDTALADALQGYTTGVAEKVKKAVSQTMKETDTEIRKHVTFRNRTGAYLKAFRTKTVHEDALNRRMRWYVAAPHFRLAHLLENGHRVVDRNGRSHGQTRAYPHIRYGAELAQRRLPELVKDAVEGQK